MFERGFRRSGCRRLVLVLGFAGFCLLASRASAADWPMWRYDAARSGNSPEQLPDALHLEWVLELPMPRPAWPDQDKLKFDWLYEPIVAGKSLFVASMVSDKVTCYDTDTARERWTFYTDAPVRFAPTAWGGKLYFSSDDGYLYCLEAADGTLLWRFRGGPSDRKVLGNGRLISSWPARGGPVIYDGTIYFAASIWPFMGVFIHALDAETGRVMWTNSGSGSTFTVQQHNSPAFAGVAPQGYLVATEEHLIVSGGRSVPAVLDRRTGEVRHFDIGSRSMGSKGGGGYGVVAGGEFHLNGGCLYRSSDGKFIDAVSGSILGENTIIGKDGRSVVGFDPEWETVRERDRRGRVREKTTVHEVWRASIGMDIEDVVIKAGTRLYGYAKEGALFAVELPRLDRGATVVWTTRLPDTPLNMVAADGKLFVASDRGRVYCFGKRKTGAVMPESSRVDLVSRGAEWTYLDGGADPGEDWHAPGFDDGEWSSGPAVLGYGSSKARTTLRYGRNASAKPISYYFRHEFEVGDPAAVRELALGVLIDDGAVIYLNGVEIGRLFMPGGTVTGTTRARSGTDETTYYDVRLPSDALRAGTNLLAVEAHQVQPDSSDVLFDLELSGWKASPARPLAAQSDQWAERAAAILDVSGASAGYCLSLGLGSGRLVEELLRLSSLHVIVIEPDRAKVDGFRRHMDRLGLYGIRVAALARSPLDLELPPYMADLVVAEDAAEARLEEGAAFAHKVFHVLRPFGGAAAFAWTPAASERFFRAVAASSPDNASLSTRKGLAVLERTDAPVGAADWTHQHGDASNSVVSRDTVVKAPLGLLWFGGPSNAGVLPRHGHGPTPHVVGGRLFIQGRDMIRAMDIYTGRLLWERTLKDIGQHYDYTSHEPGANAIGSNYISLRDGVYCVHEGRCLRLDPATGRTLSEFGLPGTRDGEESSDWGYLGAWDRYLVAGSRWTDFDPLEYSVHEVVDMNRMALYRAVSAIRSLREFEPVSYEAAVEKMALHPLEDNAEFKDEDYAPASEDDEDSSARTGQSGGGGRGRRGRFQLPEWWTARQLEEHQAYALANFNRLLWDEHMLRKISARSYYRNDADEFGDDLYEYLEADPNHTVNDPAALVLKRHILHRTYGWPDYEKKSPGMSGSAAGKGSRRLFALDRYTGEVQWKHEPVYEIRHNAIALGAGAVFAIDSMSSEEAGFLRRRARPANERASVVALDFRTGAVRWRNPERVFGTWLGYSADHDVLLQAGARAADRTVDEARRGMVAYRGASGEVLWQNGESYSGPCLLLGRKVITQGYSTPGRAFDLLTGEPVQVAHPISGRAVDWRYARKYGCNTAIGSPNLLTFRSAAAGYYDLLGDAGTANLGGFRTGCTSNLIPAGGILSAPDYTRTCTCSYQNQSSLALVHVPEAEMWSFSAQVSDVEPVRRVGLNFGAPGDRRGPDGTLWLDFPSVGGESPDVPVEAVGSEQAFEYRRYHPSSMRTPELDWVASSALEGRGEIYVPLDVPSEFQFPNEAAIGSALVVRNAALSGSAPPGAATTSLRQAPGAKALEATIAGYRELATESVTVEFWAKAAGDHYFVDSRVSGDEEHQGYVVEHARPRVRYFVSNEDSTNNARFITLEAEKAIAADEWTHIAFTYDAPTGTGVLYVNGQVVDSDSGADRRSLWWDDRIPDIRVGEGLEPASRLGELRISRVALPPNDFLLFRSTPRREDVVVGQWRMGLDRAADRPAVPYTVRLVFAEIGDLRPGERTFSVKLQGGICLENFDIAREAGGARSPVVREFRGVLVQSALRIALDGGGEHRPLLSGVQVLREE